MSSGSADTLPSDEIGQQAGRPFILGELNVQRELHFPDIKMYCGESSVKGAWR